jgi:hypothetical protein
MIINHGLRNLVVDMLDVVPHASVDPSNESRQLGDVPEQISVRLIHFLIRTLTKIHF